MWRAYIPLALLSGLLLASCSSSPAVTDPVPSSMAELLRAENGELDVIAAASLVALEAGEKFRLEDMQSFFAVTGRKVAVTVRQKDTIAGKVESLNRYFFQGLGFVPVNSTRRRHFHINQVLNTRRGYCLGLAMIYIGFARAAGVDATGVEVPGHFFVRLHHNGESVNVEMLEKGANVADSDYLRLYRIPPDAVRRGVYMRDLTDRELVANLYNNEMVHWLQRKQPRRALVLCDRALFLKPNHEGAWHNRSIAYQQLGDAEKAAHAMQMREKLRTGR